MIKQNIRSTPNLSSSLKTLLYQLQHPKPKKINKIYKQISPSVQQIKKSMKSTWKDPGFCSIQFNKVQAVRQIRISDWQRNRVVIPQRSYKSPKGLKYDFYSRQFDSPYRTHSNKMLQKKLNIQPQLLTNNTYKKNQGNIFSKTLKFQHTNDSLFGFPKNKGSLKSLKIKSYKQKQ